MKHYQQGTIRSFMAIPQVAVQNLGKLNLPEVTGRVKKYWKEQEQAYKTPSPDTEAIEFYCLNHLASVLQTHFDKDEVLPEWAAKVMTKYVETLANQTQRMFSYMLLIISREARHLSSTSYTASWYKALPSEFTTFVKSIHDSEAHTAVEAICNKAPSMALGEYTEGIVKIFGGKFAGGFGGKPWANIAKCLSKAVNGETSLELMVDSAYSLAHNNGPMFNKGMLYGHYSGEFIKILDVQRSGQIPELVLDGGNLQQVKIPTDLKKMVQEVKANLPEAFGTYVDWTKVEKLGALGKYTSDKKKMPKGPPKPKLMNGQKVIETGVFYVMPGQAVTQLKRVA